MNDGGSLYFGVGTFNKDNPASGIDNAILNNVVHDVSDSSIIDEDGYGGDGLYADEFTGDVTMRNNLVYRVSGSAVTLAGPRAGDGQQSFITNNIFAYARRAMIMTGHPYKYTDPVEAPLFFIAQDNIFYFDCDDTSMGPGVYPHPKYRRHAPFYVQGGETYSGTDDYNTFQKWRSNVYFNTEFDFNSYDLAFHTQASLEDRHQASWTPYTLAEWQASVPDGGADEDPGSVATYPGFLNPTSSPTTYYPADDYSFLDGKPPLYGFAPFDPGQAGTQGLVTPPPVPQGFPTATYDKADGF